jgi:glycosyltransferase involved in cell wall biosynthesis
LIEHGNSAFILGLIHPQHSAREHAPSRKNKNMNAKPHTTLVHISTVPFSLWSFLPGQIGFMKRLGIDVHMVSSPGELLLAISKRDQVPVYGIPMQRSITPLKDLVALARLVWRFHRIRPDIVHCHTPKAGLLGTLAAAITRVPVRIYHIHGLPYSTARGLKRRLLQCCDRLASWLATDVLCVGYELRQLVLADNLAPPTKARVPASGSINGVDARSRFNPDRFSDAERMAIRARLNIPADATVIGFVGRLVPDKGICDLAQSWQELRDEFPKLHLLLVGPTESHDPLNEATRVALESDPRVHMVGLAEDTAPYYAAMDIFTLPSYREGLNISLMEAGAMRLPIVSTQIPGVVDAVVGGQTAILVPPRLPAVLTAALREYMNCPDLRRRHGLAGRFWVLRSFQQEAVWNAIHAEYCRALNRRSAPERRGESEMRKAA